MDSYFTLQSNIEASGEFVDRKSRFIAQLVHIESEDEANAFIEMVRKRHYDARHNVPAWILVDGRERQSDDGEPSRTSGMPTLEVLRGAELKNVCCVVTRYFGGTLLGPGGLVRAYTAVTQAAVAAAREAGQIVEMTSVVPVDVHVAYPQYEQVLRLAQDSGAKVSDTDYADAVTLHLVFKAGEQEPFCAKMRELMAGRLRSVLPSLPSSNDDGRRAFGWIPSAPAVVFLLLPFTRRAALAHRRRSRRHRRCNRDSCGADPCPIRCP